MPVPGQFFPRASSRHRAACRALFRALLKPCAVIPLPLDLHLRGPVHPVRHLIRKRFRQNIKLDSAHLIRKCLKMGYLAEHLLRLAAEGVQSALEQVHTVLRFISAEAEAARHVCSQPKLKCPERPRVWPFPGAPKILDARPLPLNKISSGRRHVPSLVLTSCGFPFLRFKRPQSPYLSRMIRHRVLKKQRLLDQTSFLEKIEEIGKLEDAWEDTVLREIDSSVIGGVSGGGLGNWWAEGWGKGLGEDEQGWDSDALEARKRIDQAMRADRARTKIFGEKLTKIRLEEIRLWELERSDRIQKKRKEKLRKRLERRGEILNINLSP